MKRHQKPTAVVQAAWQQGPEAVVALGKTLRGRALDAAMDDIDRAHEMLSNKNSSLSRSNRFAYN